MVISEPAQMPPPRTIEPQPGVVLVLGGGAFHGAAHLGVIKTLEDAGVPIDLIIGTSAGSFVGALYADCPHADSLTYLITSTKTRSVFDFSPFRSTEGFISGKRLQKYLEKNLSAKTFDKLQIPFIAVTTDIEKGKTTAISSGPVAPAVNASCAIPLVFEPVQMYGTTFVDGGVMDNVATDIAREFDPLVVIAVDITSAFDSIPVLNNTFEVFIRSFKITMHHLTELRIPLADFWIKPNLTGYPYMSSIDNEKVYQAGITAAGEVLPEIMAMLKEKGIKINK